MRMRLRMKKEKMNNKYEDYERREEKRSINIERRKKSFFLCVFMNISKERERKQTGTSNKKYEEGEEKILTVNFNMFITIIE